jgi:hypothetical protein
LAPRLAILPTTTLRVPHSYAARTIRAGMSALENEVSQNAVFRESGTKVQVAVSISLLRTIFSQPLER